MELAILFTNSDRQGSYFPGQHVHGLLQVRLTSDMRIGKITVDTLGFGMIFQPPKNIEGDVQMRRELYLEENQVIYNLDNPSTGEPSLDEIEIRCAGEHTFPFSFVLPENIPSSFESPQGYVRYSLTAFVDDLVTLKTMFTVNAVYDLNKIHGAKLPDFVWTNDQPLLCCLSGTRMRVEVNLIRKGYVPGERIVINAEICNDNRHPVQMVKAILVQAIKYNHKSGPKKVKRNVVELLRGSIGAHSIQVWHDVPMLIPPLPASTLAHCTLIDIWYSLYFFVCTIGSERGITLKLPILIGTVPLKQHLDLFECGSGENPLPGEDLPTPNFEPCFFGPYQVPKSNDSEVPCMEYNPLYASYPVLSEEAEL